MMTCEQIAKLLGPYLDDEVTPDIRCAMEAHLATCRACSDELDELRDLAAQLAEPPPAAVPVAVWDAIDRRLSEDQTAERSFGRGSFRSLSLWALAASVVIVVGLGEWHCRAAMGFCGHRITVRAGFAG